MLAAYNLNADGTRYVDVYLPSNLFACAYSHYVSGQSGLPFVNEIDKNRKVDF